MKTRFADNRDSAPRRDSRGASAVEYTLLITGIAAVIVTAVFGLGQATAGNIQSVTDQYQACTADPAC